MVGANHGLWLSLQSQTYYETIIYLLILSGMHREALVILRYLVRVTMSVLDQ